MVPLNNGLAIRLARVITVFNSVPWLTSSIPNHETRLHPAVLRLRELGKISNLDMTNTTSWQPSDIMNADSGNDADSSESPKRQRGRIPQSAWSRILQRYRAGATLSAIAREFDCTPSAISYIVRKAEAEEGAAATNASESGGTPAAPAPVEIVTAPAAVAAPAAVVAAPAVSTPKAVSSITTLSLPDRGSSQPRVAATVTTAAPPPTPVAPAPRAPSPAAAVSAPVASAPVISAVVASAPVVAPPEGARGVAEPGAPKPGQPPPVDAVEARLRETARGCLVAYRGWRQAAGEASTQSLNDAVHELRKVLARIEIDMSASRREEQGLRPIPVPAHRAARQQPQRG